MAIMSTRWEEGRSRWFFLLEHFFSSARELTNLNSYTKSPLEMASRGWGREERERETEREERRERETDMRSEKRCGGGDIACTWRDVSGVFFF